MTWCWVALTVAFAVPGMPSSAQTVLGRYDAGATIAVEPDRLVPGDRIAVEINGDEIPGPFVWRDGELLIPLPASLQGVRHDVRVFQVLPDRNVEIGAWIIETRAGRRLVFGSFQGDIGVRATNDKTTTFATGAARLDFDLDEGRLRGGIGISRGPFAGESGLDEISIDDFFLETRLPIGGDDLFLRFGSHTLYSDTFLIDEATRRGISARLSDPSGAYDISAFALQADRHVTLDNVTGLSEPGDRVAGFVATLYPLRAESLRIDLAGYKGRAPLLPSGGSGDVEGAGLATSMPILDGRAELSFGIAESTWTDTSAGSPEQAGTATEAEISYQVLPPGDGRSLSVTLGHSRIDTNFYAALAPDLIRGEEEISVGAEYFSPGWQWIAEAAVAETNIDGTATDPTDRLRRFAFELFHDPGDFTGGFLNGTTFFFNTTAEIQTRQVTPAGAPPPEDKGLYTASMGIDRVQPAHSWAAFYSYERLDDRASLGLDRKSHFIDARYAYEPSEEFLFTLFARGGRRETAAGQFDEYEGAVSLTRQWARGLWEATAAAGILETEDPAVREGGYGLAEIARELAPGADLVLRGDYGSGRSIPIGRTDKGWTVSLFLRADLSRSWN